MKKKNNETYVITPFGIILGAVDYDKDLAAHIWDSLINYCGDNQAILVNYKGGQFVKIKKE